MADNVLGSLFGDIADAIRAKTGGTGTMKPNEFPDKIAAIEVGGGGSFQMKTGNLKATATKATVNHNLGVVPDIIFVTIQDISDGGYGLLYALGFSDAMMSALGGGYLCEVSGVNASMQYQTGMDKMAPNSNYGNIGNVNETSFSFGGGKYIKLEVGKYYSWYAIGGIC